MGKTTYRTQTGLVEQLMLAMNGAAVSAIDPTRDFLTVGTPRDTRTDAALNISSNDLK